MLVATQWKVVFHGTATKNGLVETFSLENAKQTYHVYVIEIDWENE